MDDQLRRARAINARKGRPLRRTADEGDQPTEETATMSTEFNTPIEACTDPRHTGARREQLGCNGPDPAEQSPAPAAAPDSTHAPGGFARGFRLVQRNGVTLDAAQFPNGRVVVMDDPDWGLCSGARSLELLLRSGYDGARVEFADEQPTEASGE